MCCNGKVIKIKSIKDLFRSDFVNSIIPKKINTFKNPNIFKKLMLFYLFTFPFCSNHTPVIRIIFSAKETFSKTSNLGISNGDFKLSNET